MRPWPDPRPVLAHAQALFLSSDDVVGWEARAIELYQEVPLGALTFADKGAVLFVNGERYAVPAAPAHEVEPTGAGDVFAAAFLVRYNTTGDPFEAAVVRGGRGGAHGRGPRDRGRADGGAPGRPVAGRAAALTLAGRPPVGRVRAGAVAAAGGS